MRLQFHKGGVLIFVTMFLVYDLGGLSFPRNTVVMLSDRPNMTIAVYRGCKAITAHIHTYKAHI